jgi:hypothetical protein
VVSATSDTAYPGDLKTTTAGVHVCVIDHGAADHIMQLIYTTRQTPHIGFMNNAPKEVR